MCIEDRVKELLEQTITNNGFTLLDGWSVEQIDVEEFDSITMVDFMVALEETFHIYIDEKSMEKIDFSNSYEEMVKGIVEIIQEKEKEKEAEKCTELVSIQ